MSKGKVNIGKRNPQSGSKNESVLARVYQPRRALSNDFTKNLNARCAGVAGCSVADQKYRTTTNVAAFRVDSGCRVTACTGALRRTLVHVSTTSVSRAFITSIADTRVCAYAAVSDAERV